MLENPILSRQPWEQTEPKSLGGCEGCQYDVTEDEEHLYTVDGEPIHDDDTCLANYVRKNLSLGGK